MNSIRSKSQRDLLTALENFGDKADTSRARETTGEYLNFIQREPRSL
jgi:hypothetical protein